MKVTVKQHVFMVMGWDSTYKHKEWVPQVWYCKVDEDANRVYIGPQEVTVDIPDDFDPVPKQVAALEAEKLAALETYQQTVATINKRLSELQALTMEAPA